jgi:hypothetical protein
MLWWEWQPQRLLDLVLYMLLYRALKASVSGDILTSCFDLTIIFVDGTVLGQNVVVYHRF